MHIFDFFVQNSIKVHWLLSMKLYDIFFIIWKYPTILHRYQHSHLGISFKNRMSPWPPSVQNDMPMIILYNIIYTEEIFTHIQSAHLPTGELPTGELPTGELPTGELPTGELPTGELPTGE